MLYKLASQGYVCFFAEHALERDLEASMGGYLYSAIGQGQQYHLGLFGPVQWGNKELKQVALVYSVLLPDSGAPDDRLRGRNYLLITMVLRQDMLHLIERSALQKDLASRVRMISDLASLTETQIHEIVLSIHGR